MSDTPPYTPDEALLGGDGVVQTGQSEILGFVPADTLVGSQNPASFRRSATLLQGECEDKYSRMVTVVLSMTRNTPVAIAGAANEGLPAYARVSFGNGGAQSEKQLEVDYIHGAMFNVPGAFLRVDAVLEDSVLDDSQISMNVQAFVGYLPMGRTRSAQRTRLAGTIAPGASVVVPIPFFSSRVEVQSNVLGTTFEIEQYPDFAALAPTLLTAVAVPPPLPLYSVPLVNQARYIRIRNTSGAPADARATFHLTV